jgi:TonB family protein
MRLMRRLAVAPLLGIFATVLFTSAFAQTPENSEWQPLRPAGEEFSIEMPKNFVFESSKMPYHKLEVNTRLYLAPGSSGATLVVVSLSGIKSNPAMYTEMERFNSYVDAFKKFLAPRLKGKDAIARMTLNGARTLNGHNGREYKIVIGDLSGVAQVYSTRKRFYGVAFLNTKKDEALQERFLSSFVLPDYVEPQTTSQSQKTEQELSQESSAESALESKGEVRQTKELANKEKPGTPAGAGNEGTTDPDAKVPEPPSGSAPKKPVSGGILNGKALSLPKPEYPAEARAARVQGTVSVQVTIDEYGNVMAANAVSGHPLLQQACVNAALLARFSPTMLMGEPVKVTGIIMYNFVAQ